jgi:heme A synthase
LSKNTFTFARFAWFVVLYNLGVILWGAVVRATGSGAGCGSHWPTCNGVIVPLAPSTETMIEFTHRLTSGLALILVAALLIWAFRAYPKGHRVRQGAVISSVFIIIEALLGAALVLFGWVAADTSIERALIVPAHLVNTFMLMAALSITAWWASGYERFHWKGSGTLGWSLGAGLLGMLVLSVTGGITALGDTLFPPESHLAALRDTLSPGANLLVQLRVFHPIIAVALGFYLAFVGGLLAMTAARPAQKRLALGLVGMFVVQLVVGLVNLLLHAPVWMQIVHLLLAEILWIILVLLTALVLAEPRPEAETSSTRSGPVLVD